MSETSYPDELARAVGLVVIYAAWAEDGAGELIGLHHGVNEPIRHRDWAASGQQLCNGLAAVTYRELAHRLERALDRRNHVVHGVFLWQRDASVGLTMKRRRGLSDPAGFEMVSWSVTALNALVSEFQIIRELIDQEISRFMGIPSPAQPLNAD
ncbi:MAG: hypothetical protein K0U80_17615 [Actinomycetia bacterium]|nr:hypothetical protein [Actinomycetes bacterium]MCH9762102.1 hypothetical protein [Actinomycetes bacterium]